jgi:hypothetical protein
MKELTPEQESQIGDDAYHEKQLRESEKKSKVVGRIPINPERFDQILIKIGRKKKP